ncbi:erythromycin esterase family protein [Chitinophaga sp. Mgbs1]|uniref:Erythromycin esterase family protein n=1 Tax=Chitinophaga solisilvae TaxID=1233460 RepID=A0A9Q5GVM7_9BACT|nr:erythromycin esterase family protein [Chitinophaga solisilvae]
MFQKVFLTAVTLLLLQMGGKAQEQADTAAARRWVNAHRKSIAGITGDYQAGSMAFLQKAAGTQRVIGLGEGTHGSSEFQQARVNIIRYLVTEKGFNIICFENSYGWSKALNDYILHGRGEPDSLMRHCLLGIWQTREVKSLLQWMRQYNQQHSRKVLFAGMDFSETSQTAAQIRELTAPLQDTLLQRLSIALLQYSQYQDEVYRSFNMPGEINRQQWLDNGLAAYETVTAIRNILDSKADNYRQQLGTAAWQALQASTLNSALAFYGIYRPVKQQQEASRDSGMAVMVTRLAQQDPGNKIIVWAHNAHIARKSLIDDSNGGGMGAFLQRHFGKDYACIGTGTAGGTVGVIREQFVNPSCQLYSTVLPQAAPGSWEALLAGVPAEQFYLPLHTGTGPVLQFPQRLAGYNEEKAPGYYVTADPRELYDGFLFFRQTSATRSLP